MADETAALCREMGLTPVEVVRAQVRTTGAGLEADARAAALRAVPGATITEIDLEEEDGFLIYDVDMVAGTVETDVAIDAGSGAVLCVELD